MCDSSISFSSAEDAVVSLSSLFTPTPSFSLSRMFYLARPTASSFQCIQTPSFVIKLQCTKKNSQFLRQITQCSGKETDNYSPRRVCLSNWQALSPFRAIHRESWWSTTFTFSLIFTFLPTFCYYFPFTFLHMFFIWTKSQMEGHYLSSPYSRLTSSQGPAVRVNWIIVNWFFWLLTLQRPTLCKTAITLFNGNLRRLAFLISELMGFITHYLVFPFNQEQRKMKMQMIL